MSDELTVERALEELREMFTPQMVDIHLRTGPCAKYARVSTLTHMWDAPTLSECLTKIRAFKQSQAKEQE